MPDASAPTYPAHPGASFLTTTGTVRCPDGRTLQTYTAGGGDDLILFESGLGQSAAYWGLVVDALLLSPTPEGVRIMGYDRSGLGGSSPPNDGRHVEDIADDLIHVLNTVSGPTGRIVLVGHSWGGPILRVAAHKILSTAYKSTSLASRLAGLVLVDPSDELCSFYFGRGMSWMSWLQSHLIALVCILGLQAGMVRAMLEPLPDPYMAATIAGCTRKAAQATAWELIDLPSKLGWLGGSEERTDVGDLPVTIITAGKGDDLGAEYREQLSGVHKERAAMCSNGKFVVAEKSGHQVIITEPGLVASEALALLLKTG